MIADALERVTDVLLRAVANDEPPTSAALRLLLRRYVSTGRDDIRDGLEPALARGLEAWPHARRDEQAGWLMLLNEALAASEDERLRTAVSELAATMRGEWGRTGEVRVAAVCVEACLATEEVSPGAESAARIAAAIDELERVVAPAYRPGEGIAHRIDGQDSAGGIAVRGRLADEMGVASALLTAYAKTGRLPYSMLAEELVQHARRTLWQDIGFADGESGARPFELNCEAVSVLCRLAALHRQDEYRTAAVLAPDADYENDAGSILAWLAPEAPDRGLAGAHYGLAATDWLALRASATGGSQAGLDDTRRV